MTLTERKSRTYIAIKVPNRTAAVVTPSIINALKDTFDLRKEFSGYKKAESKRNYNTYFCDPYCAWQKGTNRNTNGLLREFYPKGMDFSQIDEELKYYLELMNNRPRKCLGYKTPNEIIYEINAH